MKKIVICLFAVLMLSGCETYDATTKEGIEGLRKNSEQTVEYELVQLQTKESMETHGSVAYLLFIGSGSINTEEKQYYNFYVKSEDGGIKMLKEPIRNVAIYETAGLPRAENFVYPQCANGELRNACQEWVLYIPKGSILNKIDANIPE